MSLVVCHKTLGHRHIHDKGIEFYRKGRGRWELFTDYREVLYQLYSRNVTLEWVKKLS